MKLWVACWRTASTSRSTTSPATLTCQPFSRRRSLARANQDQPSQRIRPKERRSVLLNLPILLQERGSPAEPADPRTKARVSTQDPKTKQKRTRFMGLLSCEGRSSKRQKGDTEKGKSKKGSSKGSTEKGKSKDKHYSKGKGQK